MGEAKTIHDMVEERGGWIMRFERRGYSTELGVWQGA